MSETVKAPSQPSTIKEFLGDFFERLEPFFAALTLNSLLEKIIDKEEN